MLHSGSCAISSTSTGALRHAAVPQEPTWGPMATPSSCCEYDAAGWARQRVQQALGIHFQNRCRHLRGNALHLLADHLQHLGQRPLARHGFQHAVLQASCILERVMSVSMDTV
jgi:hypothetical protein